MADRFTGWSNDEENPADDDGPLTPWYVLNLGTSKFADLDRHIGIVKTLSELQFARHAAEQRRYLRRRPRSARF